MTGLRIHAAGAGAFVEDLGRAGLEAWGVAPSGAFDRAAHDRAQRLVGNAPGAAGLEVLLGGLVAVAEGDLVVAVTGAGCAVDVDGRAESRDVALTLRQGAVLRVGPARDGLRVYVAVRGGFAPEIVLGSRSWDAGGRLGPPPPGPGALLAVGLDAVAEPRYEPVVPPPSPSDLDLVPGPHDDVLDDGGRWLTASRWRVQPDSDRMGVRLAASVPLPAGLLRRVPAALPSFPVVPGSVQLTPSGDLVVLGPDAGVTGGYAVLGTVGRAGLDLLAQARPGAELRIRLRTRRSPGRSRGSGR